MLDTLSGGRVEVLFLRGTPNEHGTYDTVVEHTRAMTQEGIDLILKAWQEIRPFSWHGTHYKFSTIAIWPRISQQPHPPVFGSGNSDESVIFAAQRRMGIGFSFAPPETVRKWVDLYRAEAAKAGWAPTPNHILYRGITYVAETDQRAEADMQAHFGAKAEEAALMQAKTLGGPPLMPLVLKPYFVGGPETLIARFQALRECGVGITDLAFVIGTPEQQRRALDLFGEKVLPTVSAWDSTQFLTACPVPIAAE
jgi:alkanesulfonate monooxygenase SsuD/methylene tetrahydromethanopterin reductase-like flavin-dependent oxidoreductase (luciferase family)